MVSWTVVQYNRWSIMLSKGNVIFGVITNNAFKVELHARDGLV